MLGIRESQSWKKKIIKQNSQFVTLDLPLEKYQLVHVCRGKPETKEEARFFRFVVGRFNKEKDIQKRFVLIPCKISRCPHLPTRILKTYIKALAGFSYIPHLDGPNNTSLSQGCIFGMAPCLGMVSRIYIPRTGEVVRNPNCHVQFGGQLEVTSLWLFLHRNTKMILCP